MSLTRPICFTSTKLVLSCSSPRWSRLFTTTSHSFARQHASAVPTTLKSRTISPSFHSTEPIGLSGYHEAEKDAQLSRREVSKLNRLLRPVGRYLTAGQPDDAKLAFDRALVHAKFHQRQIYNAAILQFLRQRYFSHAQDIFRDMSEKFEPGHVLRWRMNALAIAANQKLSNPKIVSRLKKIVRYQKFPETGLRQLLHYLIAERGWSTSDALKILETYASRDTLKDGGQLRTLSERVLADVHALHGDWNSGTESVLKWGACETQDSLPRDASVYNILLRSIPADREKGVEIIMQAMQQTGVVPNSGTYGALIGDQIKRGRYDKAFLLYDALKVSKVQPDATTFSALFFALRKSLTPPPRKNRTRREKASHLGTLPSARRLFCDLLDHHFRSTGFVVKNASPMLNVSALNSALHLFMAQSDYAAAYVVIGTFKMAELIPTLRTYKEVIVTLARRMDAISKGENDANRIWFYNMLEPVRANLDESGLRNHLLYMHELLVLGSEPSLNAENVRPLTTEKAKGWLPETVFQKTARGTAPSVMMLVDMQEASPSTVWDPIPLQRVLRRAIAASLLTRADVPPSSLVTRAIRDAKEEMIPNQVVKKAISKRLTFSREEVRKADERRIRSRRLSIVNIKETS